MNQVYKYLKEIYFELSIVFLSLSSIAEKNVKQMSIRNIKSIKKRATEKEILFSSTSGKAIS